MMYYDLVLRERGHVYMHTKVFDVCLVLASVCSNRP